MQRCAVVRSGLTLRSACLSCSGQPTRGQLHLERGQPLYLEGEPAAFVYAVVSGYVREQRSTADGRAQGVRLVGPGEVTGIEALRPSTASSGDSGTYQGSAETLSEAQVCRVPRAELEQELRAHEDSALALIGALVRELELLKDTILWITVMSAEERVLALLQRFAATAPSPSFQLPITRLEMGRLLGLSHSTVSRTLHRLAKQGRLSLEGRTVRLWSLS
ncbi:MAG: Crp/Fnr family transcriptional regulator [Myxococcota bacterium]